MSAALVVARVVGVLGAMWLGVAVGVLVDGAASGLLGLGAGCVAFAIVLGVTEPRQSPSAATSGERGNT